MHRQPLLHALSRYAALALPAERDTVERLLDFVRQTPTCFERSHLAGHITGSALVTNSSFDRVLLTHHRKLDIWVQLGGHADGDPLVHRVAWQEAVEESGLSSLRFVRLDDGVPRVLPAAGRGEDMAGAASPEEAVVLPLPFDVDIHAIPARRDEPEHFHYDVRYLLVADDAEPFVVSGESHALQWMHLGEARALTQEPSMLRMFARLEELALRRAP